MVLNISLPSLKFGLDRDGHPGNKEIQDILHLDILFTVLRIDRRNNFLNLYSSSFRTESLIIGSNNLRNSVNC